MNKATKECCLKWCYYTTIPFVFFATLTRVALLYQALKLSQIDLSAIKIASIFVFGALSDIVTFCYIALPLALIYLICTKININRFGTFLRRVAVFCYIYSLCFNMVAEYLFWDEFGTRFNFIAVDYLVYRREVVDNIYESYPIKTILALLFCASSLVSVLMEFYSSKFFIKKKVGNWLILKVIFTACTVVAADFIFDTPNLIRSKVYTLYSDAYASELSKNGTYSLFEAFSANSLNYKKFYVVCDKGLTHKTLSNKSHTEDIKHNLSIASRPGQKHKKYNVVLVLVESLSAEYMALFGSKQNLTPFLDTMAQKSAVFTNYYATGTRTVRGIEATILSAPPLPGGSIVRRKNNKQIESLGSILKTAGYDNKFIYGGFGYFDNMNNFFERNDFQVVDRASIDSKDIVFANAWGVADEVLFSKFIQEADRSFSENKAFFSVVLTTSNHRPFTYPEGKIDIPSGTRREGAVKYTDYAIMQLISNAKTKPWFSNTIFIISADHCAGSAGKAELPVEKYHIPLIIYAPDIIKPGKFDQLVSQIDVAPSMLEMLGLKPGEQFFGESVFNPRRNMAFISTYQKLGCLTSESLVVLAPKREISYYKIVSKKQEITKKQGAAYNTALDNCVNFYQATSDVYDR